MVTGSMLESQRAVALEREEKNPRSSPGLGKLGIPQIYG